MQPSFVNSFCYVAMQSRASLKTVYENSFRSQGVNITFFCVCDEKFIARTVRLHEREA